MFYPNNAITILLCTSTFAVADFLTPTYPAPIDLSSNTSVVAASWRNLTATFETYLHDDRNTTSSRVLSGLENVTFSMGIFSLHDPKARQLQYHYTAPETANAKVGTRKVDGDSIYRAASVSKLITVFTGLLSLSEEDWNTPISKFIPGLEDYVRAHANVSNPIHMTQWDRITPWALATQQSGVATLGWPGGDYATVLAGLTAGELQSIGLPRVNISALGPCATNLLLDPPNFVCSVMDAIPGIQGLPPNFLPWMTAVYSDFGFMLLGAVISNVTGKPISDVYRDAVFDPLAMASTKDTHPVAEAAVARSVVTTYFDLETGFTTPSGGILSTVNDLARLGIGILNNTLLSAEKTRQWMKPQTHTASLSYSIGAPWEIHRYVHPVSGRVTDLYTKLGDSGAYGGVLVLIPQYDAGFTMLNAYSNSSVRSSAALVILDYVTSSILPALEAQAAAEATRNYVGTYVSTDKNLNASVTIGFNASNVPGITSGLTVTSWIFNGTDFLATGLSGMKPRLEPSIPKQTVVGRSGQVAFQASTAIQTLTYMEAMKVPEVGVIGTWTGLYTSNGDVFYTDQVRYGGVGQNLFVFEVDGKGKAKSCSPAVDRIVLKRKD